MKRPRNKIKPSNVRSSDREIQNGRMFLGKKSNGSTRSEKWKKKNRGRNYALKVARKYFSSSTTEGKKRGEGLETARKA